MKGLFGPKALLGVILLLAGTGFVVVEVVQRSRYRSHTMRLRAALSEFKSRSSLQLGTNIFDHLPEQTPKLDILPATERTPDPGWVEILDGAEDGIYPHRIVHWQLQAVFPQNDERMTLAPVRILFVAVVQRREFLLRSPQIHVLGSGCPDVTRLFDEILRDHGLTYSRAMIPE